MLSFENKSLYRLLIYGLSLLILGGSLFYSNYLAKQLEEKERATVRLYRSAMEITANTDPEEPNASGELLNFIRMEIVDPYNSLTPKILAGAQKEIQSHNLAIDDSTLSWEAQEVILKRELEQLEGENPPIKIDIGGEFVYIYYGHSILVKQLRWFPVIQMLVAFVFLGVVLGGFAVAKRNEQNRVWVGLAKETAHQLGTPVSSLMAWIELLKIKNESRPEDQELINEMERDVMRLENIAERFSKIGSKPELIEVKLREVLDRSAEYIKKRMTQRGSIQLIVNNNLPPENTLKVNPQLFDWVIENLLKNALDAIKAKEGRLVIDAGEKGQYYYIDVSDTGKGIPKGHFNKVFEPGFTTKKRGWGLGLSLTRRIVENYHRGKIFVKNSELDKGTTFRILLPKKQKA